MKVASLTLNMWPRRNEVMLHDVSQSLHLRLFTFAVSHQLTFLMGTHARFALPGRGLTLDAAADWLCMGLPHIHLLYPQQ